jgi:hypothetical protein
MPTAKPRVLVTLEPNELVDLDRCAEAYRRSRSAMAREIIAGSTPTLLRIASGKGSQDDVRRHVRNVLSEAVAQARRELEP